MALTSNQILSVLDIVQNFNLLNTSAPYNYENLQDVTDWASIGVTSGAGDTVKTIFQLVDPTGTIIYQNTGYVSNSYASPDTTLSSLTTTNKTLNVFTGTQIPVTGIYTVNVKVEVTLFGQSAVTASTSFTCTLADGFAPLVPQTSGPQPVGGNTQTYPPVLTLTLQETYNCDQATFTSTDVTNYTAPTGWSIGTITKTHVTTPPLGSKRTDGVTAQSAVSSSATQNYLTGPNNPLWTGGYQSSLSVVAAYIDTNGNACSIQGIVYSDTTVSCDNNYCKLECVMDDLMQDLTEAILVGNQVAILKLEKRVSLGTIFFQRIIQANLCGNTVKAQQYTTQFYQFTGGGNCSCSHCNDTAPGPVIPTSQTTGPTGATGPQGPQGAQGPTGATGAAGENGGGLIFSGPLVAGVIDSVATTTNGSYETLSSFTTDHTDQLKNLVNVGDSIKVYACFNLTDNPMTGPIPMQLLINGTGLSNLGLTGLFSVTNANASQVEMISEIILKDDTSGAMKIRVNSTINVWSKGSFGDSILYQSKLTPFDLGGATVDFSTEDYTVSAQANSVTIGDASLQIYQAEKLTTV